MARAEVLSSVYREKLADGVLAASSLDPTRPRGSPADIYWATLMLLSDDEWRKVSSPDIPDDGGPVTTGDPLVDAWERELADDAAD